MFTEHSYFIKRKILQFKSGTLLVARMINPLSYKIFSSEKKKREKDLLELEKRMLAAGLELIRCDLVTFLIFESGSRSVESIHAKMTEIASSILLEYVSIVIGYHTFSSEAPSDVIKKAFTAVSFGERDSKLIVNYADCIPQLTEFSCAVAKSTTLYNALRNSELSNVFQPIVDTETSCIVFSEFLLRVKGQETVRDYIGAAEKTNLIPAIDQYVFKRVVELLECNPDLKLSCNISMFSMNNAIWVDEFLKSFSSLQFIAKRLTVEVTEGILFCNLDRVFDLIFKLKALGCNIALDDFGRNFYIPFTQLEKLPIDYLKLDGEFAKQIKSSKNASIFVNSILEIANNLNIKVVAEFIEDRSVFDAFKDLGIRYMQGNYLYEASAELKDTVGT